MRIFLFFFVVAFARARREPPHPRPQKKTNQQNQTPSADLTVAGIFLCKFDRRRPCVDGNGTFYQAPENMLPTPAARGCKSVNFCLLVCFLFFCLFVLFLRLFLALSAKLGICFRR